VAADGLPGLGGGAQFGVHFLIGRDHAGIVHHLPQTDDTGPRHGFGHVSRADGGAGRLHSGRGRYTGGHLHKDMDWLVEGFINHQFDAPQAKNIGDFVRVDEHAGCAKGSHGAHKLGDGDHAALDMHVRVQQARDEIAPARIEHLGLRANGMIGVFAHIGDVFLDDGDISMRDDLPGLDADPLSVFDNHIRRGAAHGNVDKCLREHSFLRLVTTKSIDSSLRFKNLARIASDVTGNQVVVLTGIEFPYLQNAVPLP
jgi:hypothetical protein